MQDDFCDAATDCGEGLCCGEATAIDEYGYELGKVHVCNDEGSMEWVDHLEWEKMYTFKCIEFASNSIKVFASVTTLATAFYTLL